MASGFIEHYDGNMWSCRYTGFDLLLEQVAAELGNDGEEGELKRWLLYLQPNEEAGDVESGYCFHKANGETVLRIIDFRRMKDNYAQLFWLGIQRLQAKIGGTEAGFDVDRLAAIYRTALSNPPAPLEDEEDDIGNEIYFLGGFSIGKWPPKPEGE